MNLKCLRCRANLKELKNQRGEDAYFVPVLDIAGNNSYICDLCLQGF